MIVLVAMGLLVLAIACANIAGLVLVRGVSRRGEIAVRLALGATRARLVRLLLVENIVLAVPGAALGMLLAYRGIPFFISYAEWLAAPQRLFFNVEVDSLVIGFAAAAACGSALIFGFVPALQSSRVDLVSVINEDASPRGAARGRLRSGLVVAQVAVSLMLLVGAGLMSRSLDAARRLESRLRTRPGGVGRRRRPPERIRRDARPGLLSQAARRGARRRGHRIGDARGIHAARLPRHAFDARRHRRLRNAQGRGPGLHVQRRRRRTTSERCASRSWPAARSRIETTSTPRR